MPHVPGMSATNLMVRLDSEPGLAETEMAEEKMKQTNQEVLEESLLNKLWPAVYVQSSLVPWFLSAKRTCAERDGVSPPSMPATDPLKLHFLRPLASKQSLPTPLGEIPNAHGGRLNAIAPVPCSSAETETSQPQAVHQGARLEQDVWQLSGTSCPRHRVLWPRLRPKKLPRLQNGKDMLSVEPLVQDVC